jgi:hypothetical protein
VDVLGEVDRSNAAGTELAQHPVPPAEHLPGFLRTMV